MNAPIGKAATEALDEAPRSEPLQHDSARGHRPFLLLLLVLSLVLAGWIVRPFFHTLVLAVVLASLFEPLHQRLIGAYQGRPNLAAATVIIGLVFLILVPLFFFFTALVRQGIASVGQLNAWIASNGPNTLWNDPRVQALGEWGRQLLLYLHLDQVVRLDELKLQESFLAIGKNLGQFLVSRGAGLLGDMTGLITQFFLLIFICYYLVRDGAEMVAALKRLSPLRAAQEDRILEKIRAVARSALLGSFATAVCQGLVGGLGLYWVGVPALFWGTLMGFCSFIPLVGTALIWVPAALYLLLTGHSMAAAFLSLWCLVLVGSIDNFLRPLLMKGQAGMSTFTIFLAILGGVQVFGLIGVLYGPLILGFARVMLSIYQTEYRDLLDEEQPAAAAGSASNPPTE